MHRFTRLLRRAAGRVRRSPSYRPSLEALERREVPTVQLLTPKVYDFFTTVGQAVPISVSVTETDFLAGPVNVTFDWGDGTHDTVPGPLTLPGVSFPYTDSHTYQDANSYTVKITATDQQGSSDSTLRAVFVAPALPPVSPPASSPPAAAPGAAAAPVRDVSAEVGVTLGARSVHAGRGTMRLRILLANRTDHAVEGPLYLVLTGLDRRATVDQAGRTTAHAPGSPYLALKTPRIDPGNGVLLLVTFHARRGHGIRNLAFTPEVLAGTGAV